MTQFATSFGKYINKSGESVTFIALTHADHGRHTLINTKVDGVRISNEAMIDQMRELGNWEANVNFVPRREQVLQHDGSHKDMPAYYYMDTTSYESFTI